MSHLVACSDKFWPVFYMTDQCPAVSSIAQQEDKMNRIIVPLLILISIALLSVSGATSLSGEKTFRLDSLDGLEMVNAKGEVVTYRGRRAVHLTPDGKDGQMLAIVTNTDFKDGTIELDVAGAPAGTVPGGARGFIGVAFRAQPHAARYECFYIRPTNGRADDQLRRNHSAQYISEPDYTWQRLRNEKPGVYESYVDLETGVWTHIKVEVSGVKAKLYVNGSAQPCLIVNDLKAGESHGQIVLWAEQSTEAYFSNLTVKQ